ncbi:MAG: hypothetical protein ABEJ07_04655 [Candidatus Nanohaloarchaea archaeon]
MKEGLVEKLKSAGYNRDVVISSEEWQEMLPEEHSSDLALAALEQRDEDTYRDDRKRTSVELKDYRHRDMRGEFVAELERFNPEHHPVLHLLIDFPSWLWKNRIRNRGPVEL